MASAKGILVPFTYNVTGYPASVSGVDVINNSIFTILSTFVGERVHRPTFGCILKSFVFDPLTLATAYRVKAEIRRAIAAWEPRAQVNKIDISFPKEGLLLIQIKWTANGGLAGITNFPITTSSGG